MYIARTAQPFNDNRLRSEVPTCASTLARTSDQFRSSWRPGPNHTPRMRMGPSLQRKGPGKRTPPLQTPSRRPSFLSKLILAPATSSYLSTALTTGHKDSDIIGVHRDLRPNTAGKGSSTQSRIKPLIPKPTEQSLQSEDIEKKRQGATLPDRPLDRECLRTLFVYLHHCLRVVVQHADPFAELRLESGGLQNCCQEPIVHPVEELGLI